MGDQFNPKEESSYLQHLDVNNLNGWAMSQPIPAGEFEWVDPSQFTPDSYRNDGYLLEVDIRYPKELHDLHNDLPFMCTKMIINGVEMLVPNLNDKRKYIVHIKALNQALPYGLILEKVHQVIKFNQRAWLKLYIGFRQRTTLRKTSSNS